MQMWTGRKPGGADIADHIALGDALALAHAFGESRQVSVPGGVLGLMAQHDCVAVAALAAGKFDYAVAGGLDARADGRTVVDAFMRAPRLQHRMEARIGVA